MISGAFVVKRYQATPLHQSFSHLEHFLIATVCGAAGMIGKNLDLKRGGNMRYQKTAAYGHFGRDDPDFTWEIVKNLA